MQHLLSQNFTSFVRGFVRPDLARVEDETGCGKAAESLPLLHGPSKQIVHGIQQASVKIVPRASVDLGFTGTSSTES